MKISDLITAEILRQIEASEHNMAEIQRNELAGILGCAPSQINYVLSSRFTPEHGFIIESQRGGGGYIRIRRVVMRHSSALMHIINSIGDSIDNISARILIENCLQSGLMTAEIAKVTCAAISNNVMRRIPLEHRDSLRATILKELFFGTDLILKGFDFMLCEKCGKNNANTHIKTIVNGVVKEKNLCSHCAAMEGYKGIGQNPLSEMLSSVFGDVLNTGSLKAAVRCECCGATFSDIAQTGKVGCSECYKTFYSELLPYLKRVHGSTKHAGKVPNRAPLTVRPKEDTVESLRYKLNELVRREMFEEAAIVRDKIKKLEGEKNNG